MGSVFIWGGLVYIGIVLPILIIPIILLTNSVGVDTGFNKSVGYHIGYIGKTSEWDKFIRKTPIGADGVLYQMCKIVIAAVLFIIYKVRRMKIFHRLLISPKSSLVKLHKNFLNYSICAV